MGYQVYENRGRWQGYGVPAVCDHPDCDTQIDRGLAYLCGDAPRPEKGCGLFFCGDHLYIARTVMDDDPQMCQRCCDGEPPFAPKADTPDWTNHMLTDDSWAQWRAENPEAVAQMQAVTA